MTPTTLRDREPVTEAGKAYMRGAWPDHPDTRQVMLDTIRAIEEQAATEARRELLAKVEGLRAEIDAEWRHLNISDNTRARLIAALGSAPAVESTLNVGVLAQAYRNLLWVHDAEAIAAEYRRLLEQP